MSQVTDLTEHGLYFRSWKTNDEAKAVVLLVHGLGEHCQRYEALAAHLNQAGYALHSMDLPCHGRSQGRRGHVDSFDVFQSAVLTLYQRCLTSHPDRPIFLLGHSMGGLIATRFLLDHQTKFSGALLSGAAIQSPQEPPTWQLGIIRTIAKLAPKLSLLGLDASKISRDPKVVEKYMSDPLVSKDKLSAQFLVAMTDTMEHCKTEAKHIALPIFIMHGSQDAMTSPRGSQLLYDSVSSVDKSLKVYDGLYHEIFNEPEANSIFQEMVTWLDTRIQ